MIIGIATLSFFGCKKIALPKKENKAEAPQIFVSGTIIAKVNSMPITLEQLNKEIDTFNQVASDPQKGLKKIETKDEKVEYLNKEFIKRYLLYQEALDKKVDTNPEVREALEAVKMQILIAELLKTELASTDISSSEIQEFYDKNKAFLKSPEERRVREIVTDSEDQAKQALIELLQGKDFAAVASLYSRSPSSSKGGDLGFLQPAKTPTEFDEAVFSPALEKGKFSNIFKGPKGYYIVKIEDIRGGQAKPLSEMREDIKNYLILMKQEKQIQDLIGKLQSQAKIEVFEDKIR